MDEKRFQKMLDEIKQLNSNYENIMKNNVTLNENEIDKDIIKDAYYRSSRFLLLQFSKNNFFIVFLFFI